MYSGYSCSSGKSRGDMDIAREEAFRDLVHAAGVACELVAGVVVHIAAVQDEVMSGSLFAMPEDIAAIVVQGEL